MRQKCPVSLQFLLFCHCVVTFDACLMCVCVCVVKFGACLMCVCVVTFDACLMYVCGDIRCMFNVGVWRLSMHV